MNRRPNLSLRSLGLLTCVLLVGGLAGSVQAATPAAPSADRESALAALASHVSSGPATRAWLADPASAPAAVRPRIEALAAVQAGEVTASERVAAAGRTAFNDDDLGLPQNEESLTVCRRDPDVVLGGTNDYRGLLNPRGNFTGWHFSRDGGQSLLNEGLLPAVAGDGVALPSGGDPVNASYGPGCALYAASLNYDFALPGTPNGIGVYRTTPQQLADCSGGDRPACWPTRRAVATNRPGHFLDKEWMTVGRSGDGGRVVWVTYTDFDETAVNPAGFTAALYAVRCSGDLARCTDPIKLSGDDRDVQFSDVTIDSDGRTYVTWSQIKGEIPGRPQTFVHKLRVARPGSTTFGPTRVVHKEDLAIPFGGKLNASDFRVATYPKNAVTMVDGHPRIFVTWDACSVRVLGETVCEDAVVKLAWSDDLGRSWHRPAVVSSRGNNYFPTIDTDGDRVVVGYFTSRYDLTFDNRQDVELATLDTARPGAVTHRQRLTSVSNEPEADSLLGGVFIGDYIEVVALHGRAWLHYNANYDAVPLLGEGVPVPQQDNVLTSVPQ